MSKIKLSFLALATLTISSCALIDNFRPTHSTTEVSPTSVGTTEGQPSSSLISSVTNPESSSSIEPVKPLSDFDFSIYATNDLHGQVYEDSGNNFVGIEKAFTYLKNVKNDNSHYNFLIDSGDVWQGSVYSNHNKGKLITQLMNHIHYDVRTIGNHDFDWGIDTLVSNNLETYDGYRVPALCANVYDFNFDTKQVGTTQQSQIGKPSVTYTLDNGFKLGIVGVIGSAQITSICTNVVKNVAFTDHVEAIKSEATKLKVEGCNAVIASVHGDYASVANQNLADYVDLVLCAHTHRLEMDKEGDLNFVQFAQKTSYVGKIDLHYDAETNKVSCTEINPLGYNDINNSVTEIDATIKSITNTYKDETDSAENPEQVLINQCNGYLRSDQELPNLMCEAIYNSAVDAGYNVKAAIVNYARVSIGSSSQVQQVKYNKIFEAFPFDNTVYIMSAYGSEIKNEANMNFVYIGQDSLELEANERYDIAVIDYLAYHTGTTRYFNYFSKSAPLNDMDTTPKLDDNYRVILKDYLVAEGYSGTKQLNASDYRTSGRFSPDSITVN